MLEEAKMEEIKKEMEEFMKPFNDMPDRLIKYIEILIRRENASPYSYQDTMSFRRLAIELTTHCNLNCIWCYRGDPAYKHILNKDMPFEKLKKIVENTNGKFRMVHLGGLGEPLLYPKIIDAVELVKNLSDKVKITTNGILLTEKLIDKLVDAGLTHIEISIDAFSKHKNIEFRGANLDKILKMIKYISDQNRLYLQINSVVANINYEYLLHAVEILKECKNIKILHLIPLFETKQCQEHGIQRISEEDFQGLLKKLYEDIQKYGLKWRLEPPVHGGIKADPIIEMKRRLNICFTCFEDPYISVEGELLPCGRQKLYGGADATFGFEKAWNHPKLLKFRENMLKGRIPKLCRQLCYLKYHASRCKL